MLERIKGMLTRQAPPPVRKDAQYSPVYNWTAQWNVVYEANTGYFQQSTVVNRTTVQQNWAFFSCLTLIARYIANLPPEVRAYDEGQQVHIKKPKPAVLNKPNRYQTRVEFFRSWVLSLNSNGNTYVLKERASSGAVVALHVLDFQRVTPLVTPSGDVYYQLAQDHLAKVEDSVIVPASEIIHDKINTIWHPLIGLSPITANGVAAMQSQAILDSSTKLFQNRSMPGGILTAPGEISEDTASRLKESWQTNYTGSNAGKVAVLGDGLEFKPIVMNATDAQLIEQLKFSGEMICATFMVPSYKLGLGQMPTNNNTAALNQQFYDQCLQPLIENMELLLKEGLGLPDGQEIWFDISGLLRMDPSALYQANGQAVKDGWMAPNEARRTKNLPPVEGGETPYLQQQNFSLAALAQRDADDPFSKPGPAPDPDAANDDEEMEERAIVGASALSAQLKSLPPVISA